jgi:hypothetical protein
MQPTEAQLKSLVALGRWLTSAYGIDPATIKGHRDQQSTSCPGDILYAKLDQIRRDIAAAPPAPKPVVRGSTNVTPELGTSERVFQIIDGNLLRSLVGPQPDLDRLRELDKLFDRNRR